MKMYCGNQATKSIAKHPIHHDRAKQVEIDRHFIKDKIEEGIISLVYTPNALQTTNIFTTCQGLTSKTKDPSWKLSASSTQLDRSVEFHHYIITNQL